jgi:hypothetical protein
MTLVATTTAPEPLKDKGYLFAKEMVQALLDGRKHNTIRPHPGLKLVNEDPINWQVEREYSGHVNMYNLRTGKKIIIKKPVQVGQIIYARENTAVIDGQVIYQCDFEDAQREILSAEDFANIKWTPSIHMPAERARIKLKVWSVSLIRLKDVNDFIASKEGLEGSFASNQWKNYTYQPGAPKTFNYPKESFRSLWETLYGPYRPAQIVWLIKFKNPFKNPYSI